MGTGELLTRGTIWLSMLAYTAGCVVFATRRNADRWVRLAWTTGCAALIAHLICAFQFYHSWSQQSAYLDTARQTYEVVGLSWGGGLFINYALAFLWTADIAWWWFAGVDAYRRRSWFLTLLWHGFLVFIIFNATVVFKHGPTRWIGVLVSLTLCWSWILSNRQRSVSNSRRGGTPWPPVAEPEREKGGHGVPPPRKQP